MESTEFTFEPPGPSARRSSRPSTGTKGGRETTRPISRRRAASCRRAQRSLPARARGWAGLVKIGAGIVRHERHTAFRLAGQGGDPASLVRRDPAQGRAAARLRLRRQRLDGERQGDGSRRGRPCAKDRSAARERSEPSRQQDPGGEPRPASRVPGVRDPAGAAPPPGLGNAAGDGVRRRSGETSRSRRRGPERGGGAGVGLVEAGAPDARTGARPRTRRRGRPCSSCCGTWRSCATSCASSGGAGSRPSPAPSRRPCGRGVNA